MQIHNYQSYGFELTEADGVKSENEGVCVNKTFCATIHLNI